MNRHLYKRLFCALVFVSAWGIAVEIAACSVPVFRYALERWERDEYRLIVASQGELPPEHQMRVDELNQQSYQEDGFINLTAYSVDVTDEENAAVLEAYPVLKDITEPTACLLYPRGAYLPTIIMQEPFSDETVKKLSTSALVEDLTMEILSGTSAVWVLVDSGNKELDDEAYKVLVDRLNILGEEMELPAGVIETSGHITGGMTEEDIRANFDPANFLQSGIPLKIGFAVKRLAKEKAEPVFRAILMNSEADLENYKGQPLAFPVFGRGRFLLPLVGDGINPENIEMATRYVCGICSCQVKSGNPGIDLLSHVDWSSYLEGSEVVHDRALPPLTGTADLVNLEEAVPEVLDSEIIEPKPSSSLARNLVIVLGVVLGLMVGASVAIKKKK